jgi:hypothetical protein
MELLIANVYKPFNDCTIGENTGTECIETGNNEFYNNQIKDPINCNEGLLKDSKCYMTNNPVYVGTKEFDTCPTGFEYDKSLGDKKCIRKPPGGYYRNNGDDYYYYRSPSEIASYSRKSRDAIIDNSACNNLDAPKSYGIGTCTGWDGKFSCKTTGCGCIKGPVKRSRPCDNLKGEKYYALTCTGYKGASLVTRKRTLYCDDGLKSDGTNCWEDVKTRCDGGFVTRNAPRKCPDGYELDKFGIRCYEKCRDGFNDNGGSDIISCWNDKPLSRRINDDDKETTGDFCKKPKEDINGKCYIKCPDGTVRDSGDPSRCIPICPYGFTKDSTGKCVLKQTNQSANICPADQVMINNECFDMCKSPDNPEGCIDFTCAPGATFDKTTSRCLSNITTNPICQPEQKTINGKCYNPCNPGYNMDETTGNCIPICDTDFIYNEETGVCEKIIPFDKCELEQTLIDGKCYDPCPDGYTMNPTDGQCNRIN